MKTTATESDPPGVEQKVPESVWAVLWKARVDWMVGQGFAAADAWHYADTEIRYRKDLAENGSPLAIVGHVRFVWDAFEKIELGFDFGDHIQVITVPVDNPYSEDIP